MINLSHYRRKIDTGPIPGFESTGLVSFNQSVRERALENVKRETRDHLRLCEALEDGEKASDSERLGNNTKFASKTSTDAEKEQVRKLRREDNIRRRYHLNRIAGDLLPKDRVAKCMKFVIGTDKGKGVEVWKENHTGHAFTRGVATCGSVWTCATCAAKISAGRRQELEEAMQKALDKGWVPVFVTLTARHTREDLCTDTLKAVQKAKRRLRSGGWWQRNIKSLDYKGGITGLDYTYGLENGHHVHIHMIMFFGVGPDLEALENSLFERWNKCLKPEGLDCSREHGVKVLPGNRANDYIAKWGLQDELTSNNKKGKAGHYTSFQLLELHELGNNWAGPVFVEFAEAFKGANSLRWSGGLRDALEMGKELTDQEMTEAPVSDDCSMMGVIKSRDYYKLLRVVGPMARAELQVMAERGLPDLIEWLLKFGIYLEAGHPPSDLDPPADLS